MISERNLLNAIIQPDIYKHGFAASYQMNMYLLLTRLCPQSLFLDFVIADEVQSPNQNDYYPWDQRNTVRVRVRSLVERTKVNDCMNEIYTHNFELRHFISVLFPLFNDVN